jgi:hypothetical protein
MIRIHFDTYIYVFRADSAGEYLSDALWQVLAEKGTRSVFVLVSILRMGLLSASIIICLKLLVLL